MVLPAIDFSKISPFIATGIAGASTLLAAIIAQRGAKSRDRALAAKRTQQLDHATKRAQFWDTWQKAITPLGDAQELHHWKALAKEQLLAASDEMEVAVAPLDAKVKEHKREQYRSIAAAGRLRRLPRWRRVLLLYVPMHRFALVPAIAAYVFLILLLSKAAYDPMQSALLRRSYEHERTAILTNAALKSDQRDEGLSKADATFQAGIYMQRQDRSSYMFWGIVLTTGMYFWADSMETEISVFKE